MHFLICLIMNAFHFTVTNSFSSVFLTKSRKYVEKWHCLGLSNYTPTCTSTIKTVEAYFEFTNLISISKGYHVLVSNYTFKNKVWRWLLRSRRIYFECFSKNRVGHVQKNDFTIEYVNDQYTSVLDVDAERQRWNAVKGNCVTPWHCRRFVFKTYIKNQYSLFRSIHTVLACLLHTDIQAMSGIKYYTYYV